MPATARASFQVFAKPVGAACNLACEYCYYRFTSGDDGAPGAHRMPEDVLETYIRRHIEACPDEIVRFSWHGGEPTLAGIEFFRRAVALQKAHRPKGRRIVNGMQTNGTLLDDAWGRFLSEEGFFVGVSLDGPRALHDRRRVTRDGSGTFGRALRGYEVLRRYRVPTDVLCVVGADNVRRPAEVYGFLKSIGASLLTFLPLVVPRPDSPDGASPESVPAEDWGEFLVAVFDEWTAGDIGRVKAQIFEEAVRGAFGEEHSLCLFRPECGDVPVVERDGSIFSCDHFVDRAHRIGNVMRDSLADVLDGPAQRAFGRAKADLPADCRACDVLDMCNGECPKNRIMEAPDGGPRLNYLCAGYRRFFRHVRPWVDAVGAERRRRNAPAQKR